jgi:DNA polymerase III delta prime subunit
MTELSLCDLWRSSARAGRFAPAWAVLANPDRFTAIVDQLRQILNLKDADLISVRPEEGKRTLARPLVAAWLAQANLAPRGERQLAVLYSAHMLQPVVASILLKALEEPPAGTIFLLLMSRDSLLATIRSRVQLVAVEDVSDEQPGDLLPTELSAILKWAPGAIEQEHWPETVQAVLQQTRRDLAAGKLTGLEAERALKLALSTTAGLNRKLQLVATLAKK